MIPKRKLKFSLRVSISVSLEKTLFSLVIKSSLEKLEKSLSDTSSMYILSFSLKAKFLLDMSVISLFSLTRGPRNACTAILYGFISSMFKSMYSNIIYVNGNCFVKHFE